LENSNTIDEIVYVFNFNKANVTNDILPAFKTLFSDPTRKTEIFNAIWDNQGLRNDLFGTGISRVDAELDFLDLINSTDSKLYNFIKSE